MLFGGHDALKADLSAQRGVRQHQSHTDNNHTLRCLLEYVSYSPNHSKAAEKQQIRLTHVIANCEWHNTMTPPQKEGVSTYPLIPDFFLHSKIYKVSKVLRRLSTVSFAHHHNSPLQAKLRLWKPWRTMFKLNLSFNTFHKRPSSSRSPHTVSRSAEDKQWQIFPSSEASYFLVFWEALQCNTIVVGVFRFDAFPLVMRNSRPRSAASWHEVDVNPFMSDIRRQDAAERE